MASAMGHRASSKIRAPAGATLSTEHETVVVFYFMTLQECLEFVFERLRPMVFSLVFDIARDVGNRRFAHGERGVSVLPGEFSGIRKRFIKPFR